MKQIGKFIIIFIAVTLVTACKKEFLESRPQGSLDEAAFQNEKGISLLITSVYAGMTESPPLYLQGTDPLNNWLYGSVAGGESTKGSSVSDQPQMTDYESFIVNPSNAFNNRKWVILFDGVSRANNVLKTINKTTTISESYKKQATGEVQFLRALLYFELRRSFNKVPWMDETFVENDPKVKNDQEIYPKIEADLENAITNLPELPGSGRANIWAAKALLAKVYIYQKKFTDAEPILKDIIDNGKSSTGLKFSLVPNFSDVYNVANEANNPEAIFDINYFTDGSLSNNNIGWAFAYPLYVFPNSGYGFWQPTYDLVNSYQVDASGLPYLDNGYRTRPSVTNVVGISASSDTSIAVDPRLDWTVGRPSVPIKDYGFWTENNIRDMGFGGPFFVNKMLHWKSQKAEVVLGNVLNYHALRLGDIILFYAECLAENGKPADARDWVNMIRTRAKNSTIVKNGTKRAANYRVGLYPVGQFATKDEALKAIRFERKIELALEGHRFFDLSRWGGDYAKTYLDSFIEYEKTKIPHYALAVPFDVNKIYSPIPLTQIQTVGKDASGTDLLQQNTGY